MSQPKYLGNKAHYAGIDTFETPENIESVNYVSDEVSALCPVTGQPDYYTVHITIDDAPELIESKSLKLYLQSFRNEGIFCEVFAGRIARELAEATRGVATVSVMQKPRGGISIDALARFAAGQDLVKEERGDER